MMKKQEIWKITGTSYKENTKRLLTACELERMIPDHQTRIGIKPNLVGPIPAEYGATTHPEIIAGIIEYLQERHFTEIVLIESSWVGDRTSESIEVCGYDRICEQYRIPFIDVQKDSSHTVDAKGMELQISDAACEIEYLINVPVLKGHCQTKVTCALKNMKGLIPNGEKRHFHACGLHKPIAHLSACLHQDLIVVDQICGDPDCEDGGNPYVQNCIMAALDPVLCDAYGAALLGIEADQVPYLGYAEELGVGTADLRKLCIRTLSEKDSTDGELYVDEMMFTELLEKTDGRSIEGTGSGQKRKRMVDIRDRVEEVDSCSACYANLVPALLRLQEERLLDKLPDRIAIGQGFRGKIGTLGIGNCTKGFAHTLPGCPAGEDEIYDFLVRICLEGDDRSV